MASTWLAFDDAIDEEPGHLVKEASNHQIVMNLCTNAFRAMEKTGGVLEISMQRFLPLHTSLFDLNDYFQLTGAFAFLE